MRGYCGIGIENFKKDVNVGTLWRSAYNLGASFIFTIGKHYERQSSDTVIAMKHIPLFCYEDVEHFLKSIPADCKIVGIEILDKSLDLTLFNHPERAIYVLENESRGLSPELINKCDYLVKIDSVYCLNVSVAGSIILYDRNLKEIRL